MKFISSHGLKPDFITDIDDLDHSVYSKDYVGYVESIKNRFLANDQQYFLCVDDNKLIGYICFFPISENLEKQLLMGQFLDDNIQPNDILKYEELPIATPVLIISIMVDKNYQKQGVGTKLFNLMIDFLKKQKHINKLYCEVVSKAGTKLINNWKFKEVKLPVKNYKLMTLKLK